jgi:pyridinium-3,5-bisthiocarboxylic acid mononucleotide nickel chelatase
MKIAFFDCYSGASGDMILGALLDAGLAEIELLEGLNRLNLHDFEIRARKTRKAGISGTKVDVAALGNQHARHYKDIVDLIRESDLPEHDRENSLRIFLNLAQAEAKVHGISLDQVHFHEIGAIDSIIDVVGAVVGLSKLGIQRIYCSPINVGSGTVRCEHGILPVPAPATAELIKGKPTYSSGIQAELLTPTGAAILATLAHDFGSMPEMKTESVGYGAGKADLPIPNMLRVMIGDAPAIATGHLADEVAVIETGIDDMNPQIYGHLFEKLLEMGALDVFLTPVQMKKNRPAVLLSIICPPERLTEFAAVLMSETTTIGVRWRMENRIKAVRTIDEIMTEFGAVRFKRSVVGETTVNVSPEYEDCRRIAKDRGLPLKTVMERILSAASTKINP